MRIRIILITTFLTWTAVDLQLLKRRRLFRDSSQIELSLEQSDRENEQEKKSERHRLDVIPVWQRGRRKPLQSRCNYFSTKPRDHRFSDQRKIRRMFNNC
jgi:hypothetical protein